MKPRNRISRDTIGLTIDLTFEVSIVGLLILFSPSLRTQGVKTKFTHEERKANIGRTLAVSQVTGG